MRVDSGFDDACVDAFVAAYLDGSAGARRARRSAMPDPLYMIVEHFKNKDPVPIYRRFRERGRMLPEGVTYVSSWVDEKLERCFQLMEAREPALLDRWAAQWADLGDFEIHPVITSEEAARRVAPRL
jgi:hypothetical protein